MLNFHVDSNYMQRKKYTNAIFYIHGLFSCSEFFRFLTTRYWKEEKKIDIKVRSDFIWDWQNTHFSPRYCYNDLMQNRFQCLNYNESETQALLLRSELWQSKQFTKFNLRRGSWHRYAGRFRVGRSWRDRRTLSRSWASTGWPIILHFIAWLTIFIHICYYYYYYCYH